MALKRDNIQNTKKKIRLIRAIRSLTQKQLAEKVGTHEVMIRKYEIGKAVPRDEQLRKIAMALEVNANSLREFEINDENDVLPLLFAIDEKFPITIKEIDGVPGIFFESDSLNYSLSDWQAMKKLMMMGQQNTDNYELWKTIRPGVTKNNSED